MNHWLVKSEPGTYSWAQFVQDRRTAWTGVRNFQARNHLRAMRPGDPVLFYHSGEGREIVGLAKVVKAAYADPTATDGNWSCVDLAAEKPLDQPVSLAIVKADPALKAMLLVTNSRLSVQSVTAAQFKQVLKLAAG
jgi:predicted RNA-binding protein with PUA-like domain